MTLPDDGPLVTVAIPTFRRPDMLRGAIRSALAQTYRNIEVLVSDSAADPEIAALVASFGDPRLRYRDNGCVSDMSTNGRALYADARGEFIGTLHDDDEWMPDFLEQLLPPLLADPEVVLSFGDHWIIDAEGRVREDLTEAEAHKRGRSGLQPGRHQPFFDEATASRAISLTVAGVFRASALDLTLWRHEAAAVYDMWLAYLLARDGRACWYVPARVSRYRHHPDAATSVARLDEAAVWAFDRFLADERLASIRPGLRRAAAPHHVGLALTTLRSGGPDARQVAARHLRAASRGGWRTATVVGWAMWATPTWVRRRVIDTVRRLRARRASRGSGPAV